MSSIKKSLILKNLAAHRIKNRRTALMFSLAVSMAVYLWVSLEVQLGLVLTAVKQ